MKKSSKRPYVAPEIIVTVLQTPDILIISDNYIDLSDGVLFT